MTLKDALKRIDELERKVKELEMRPAQQIHYHYTYPQLQYWQAPYVLPQYVPVGPVWIGSAGGTYAGAAGGSAGAGGYQVSYTGDAS